jgi:hypothetical protein
MVFVGQEFGKRLVWAILAQALSCIYSGGGWSQIAGGLAGIFLSLGCI